MHFEYSESLNPIADWQRCGNDKDQAQSAQAGGFWRSRRQRRKDL
ncbi:hypothetical protein ABH904_002709 [Pseudomonas frederiksbergensis]